MLCEEWITPIETQNALLVPQNSKSTTMMKPQMEPKKNGKHCRNCGWNSHNVEICRVKKKEKPIIATTKATNQP